MRRRFMTNKALTDANYFYLTNKSTENYSLVLEGSITFNYSYDKKNWLSSTRISIGTNETVYLCSNRSFSRFLNPLEGEAGGNIMSLIYEHDFEDKTELPRDNIFLDLFDSWENCTFDNLILPATTLSNSCYLGMFGGCSAMTKAPTLPATTLTSGCYSGMFRGCSNLRYIKMLATDVSASNCLSNWVYGVAATGTFVKNSDATWDIIGDSGVPTGWTVLDNTFPTNEYGFPESTEFSFPLYLNFPKEPTYEDEYCLEYYIDNEIVDSLIQYISNNYGSYIGELLEDVFIDGYKVTRIHSGGGILIFYGIDSFDSVEIEPGLGILGYKEK